MVKNKEDRNEQESFPLFEEMGSEEYILKQKIDMPTLRSSGVSEADVVDLAHQLRAEQDYYQNFGRRHD